MKIVICMKQVPVKDARLTIRSDGGWIEEQDLNYEINESDHYALEEALRLQEKLGGEVIVCAMGPERVKEAIKQGLAKGAHRAIYINDTEAPSFDPFVNASRLAAVLGPEKPDFILTGLQTDDLGWGQTGVILAELLGLPHATIVMEIEASDSKVKVKRELESGWFQWVELPLPALLTIQSGINQIRYATIKGIMAAKRKEIREIPVSELDVPAEGHLGLARLYIPEKKKKTELLEGDPKEVAEKLVEKLRNEAKVL